MWNCTAKTKQKAFQDPGTYCLWSSQLLQMLWSHTPLAGPGCMVSRFAGWGAAGLGVFISAVLRTLFLRSSPTEQTQVGVWVNLLRMRLYMSEVALRPSASLGLNVSRTQGSASTFRLLLLLLTPSFSLYWAQAHLLLVPFLLHALLFPGTWNGPPAQSPFFVLFQAHLKTNVLLLGRVIGPSEESKI